MQELRDFAGSVSIVVSSCDRFFDAWRPFAFFFRKFWPDCPFAVHLITNELGVRSDFIRPLAVGPDRGWASNMQTALSRIETPYVLYFQEDYFLTAPVDEAQLASDFRFAVENDAAAFCFYDLSLLEPEFGLASERFRLVPEDSKGRTRLQTTLWKRDALASLLVPGENAWHMEARGSERTRGLRIFSYTRNADAPIPYLMSGIVRGLWTPEALALCRAHRFHIRPKFRSTLALTKAGRRWGRALGRVRYPWARLLQGSRPVGLDEKDIRGEFLPR
ncbi:MAG: hypothetical protein M3Y80_05015 [Verrucomicrobiota bacterium]|nr:hypothetical protein [Verrucomicrobiota bacterium]